jgi:hypothetical protein
MKLEFYTLNDTKKFNKELKSGVICNGFPYLTEPTSTESYLVLSTRMFTVKFGHKIFEFIVRCNFFRYKSNHWLILTFHKLYYQLVEVYFWTLSIVW